MGNKDRTGRNDSRRGASQNRQNFSRQNEGREYFQQVERRRHNRLASDDPIDWQEVGESSRTPIVSDGFRNREKHSRGTKV